MQKPSDLRIGNTRLIKLENNFSFNYLDLNLFAKLELNNPTGSHKDRESFALVSHCKATGLKEIGCASTGNFGISLAYLANISKIKCHVWVSNKLSPFRESYLKSFGAIIHKVKGDLFDIYRYSSEEMLSRGIYDANPCGNQIKIKANKLIFEEIKKDLPNVSKIITCINNGTHYLGLCEAAQTHGIPIYAVFTHDNRAKSIAGFSSYEGLDKIKKMIKINKGRLIEAKYEDINQGLKLTKENGLIVEAASACVIGVAMRLSLNNQNTCCVITGNGLKYPEEISLNN